MHGETLKLVEGSLEKKKFLPIYHELNM